MYNTSEKYLLNLLKKGDISHIPQSYFDNKSFILKALPLCKNQNIDITNRISARLLNDLEVVQTIYKCTYNWAVQKGLLKTTYNLCCYNYLPDFIIESGLRYAEDFQIELKKMLGEYYPYKNAVYNNWDISKLNKQKHKYQKYIINKCRQLYACPVDKYIEKLKEFSPSERVCVLYSLTKQLRKNQQPFCDIVNLLEERILTINDCREQYFSYKKSGSYPERLMTEVLEQCGVFYIREKIFDWSRGISETGEKWTRRYDFYLPNHNMIIETHGGQHYTDGFRSYEVEHANDIFKRQLALSNGIKHYAEIDASSSNVEYIKNSMLKNSDLCDLLPLSDINWEIADKHTIGYIAPEKRPVVQFDLYDKEIQFLKEWIDVYQEEMEIQDVVVPAEAISASCYEIQKEEQKEKAKEMYNNAPKILDGLTAGEIFLLEECNKHYVDVTMETTYKTTRMASVFGLLDTSATLLKLFNLGYIKEGDIYNALSKFTIKEIRNILRENGITSPPNCNKNILIDYVVCNITPALHDIFTKRKCYIITEKGQNFLYNEKALELASLQHQDQIISSLGSSK